MSEAEIQSFTHEFDVSFAQHVAWLMRQMNAGRDLVVNQGKPHEIAGLTADRAAREALYILLGKARTLLALSMDTNPGSPARLQLAIRMNEFAAAHPLKDET